jgi:outer membrane lipoprotein-sorting protein
MFVLKLKEIKMKQLAITSILFLISCLSINSIQAQNLSAKEIIQKVENTMRGSSNFSEIKMTIIRPDWSREMTMKSWAKGEELALIQITGPARDKGTMFLKRKNELWNWQPKINKTIKMPPSMLTQSWMGSDFSNDDLVRQSSFVHDFEHKRLPDEKVEGRDCYVVVLNPKEDVPVVWGSIKFWVDKKEFIQMKSEFYDEDEYLVSTIQFSEIKNMGGRPVPTVLTVTPAEDEENKTIIEYLSLEFNQNYEDSFFTIQNMKRIK